MHIFFVIWNREIKKFFRSRRRLMSSIVSPIITVLVFSYIVSNEVVSSLGISSLQFLIPGIIGLICFTSALSESVSLVEDKNSGFMKEFLISPISRSTLVLGRIFGDSTKAIFDGGILLIMSMIVGVEYTFISFVIILCAMILTSLSGASVGIIIACNSSNARSLNSVIQLITFPLLLLSGSYIPISLLPNFLKWIAFFNPVTYVVSFFRYVSFYSISSNYEFLAENQILLKIGNWIVNPVLSFCIFVLIGLSIFMISVKIFDKSIYKNY
jgi:ABC-2 type transport system permease protein